jgi:hypothetical protein
VEVRVVVEVVLRLVFLLQMRHQEQVEMLLRHLRHQILMQILVVLEEEI